MIDDATMIEAVLRVAIQAAEPMPPSEKADVYDGISRIARDINPDLSKQACDLAAALREAELLQLHFKNLFKS